MNFPLRFALRLGAVFFGLSFCLPALGDDAPAVSFPGGRPTFSTPDGAFSASLRALVQYDSAYYAQAGVPPGTDFSSGNVFRRARLGFSGIAASDWSYEFLYDMGGQGTESPAIASAFVQYNGAGPVHFRIGAYATPESLDDTTGPADLLFLERAQPVDLARGIAGSDGRDAATLFAYDERYFAALSFTGGVAGEAPVFDEQQAVVARFAWRLIAGPDFNLVAAGDLTQVIRLADAAADSTSANSVRLRERPELGVDSQSIRLIDTGAIAGADGEQEWGGETGGTWRNLYAQGGYFHFSVPRHGNALADPQFAGWYAQASWVVTGETRPWSASRGAFVMPSPAQDFSWRRGQWGAIELAARYSDLDLDDSASGIHGGEQKIWSAGLNWYPNSVLRFMLDYQHTNVSRTGPLSADPGAHLDAVSLRTQVAF